MVLLMRSIQTVVRSSFQEKVKRLSDSTTESFRVLPFDIDIYRHMNHARYLTYMEAARWGLQQKSGFLNLALKKGWIAPVSCLSIEYFRPLRLFQEFRIISQFVKVEEKWFYVLHRVWSGEKEVARALLKATIRKRRENIPPPVYLKALGFNQSDVRCPEDVREWVNCRV